MLKLLPQIINLHSKGGQNKLFQLVMWLCFIHFSGPRIITVPEDSRPGSLLGFFLISNNEGAHRGVSCYLKQVYIIQNKCNPQFQSLFQISPFHHQNSSIFAVRKELTPSVNGDTKCSVYLQKKLDYEIHASYIMQIIAEVQTKVFIELLTFNSVECLGGRRQ